MQPSPAVTQTKIVFLVQLSAKQLFSSAQGQRVTLNAGNKAIAISRNTILSDSNETAVLINSKLHLNTGNVTWQTLGPLHFYSLILSVLYSVARMRVAFAFDPRSHKKLDYQCLTFVAYKQIMLLLYIQLIDLTKTR